MRSGNLLRTVSGWKPLVAIRTGYATLLPLILLQGIAIATAAAIGLFFDTSGTQALRDLLYYTHKFVLSVLPALSVCTISYHAATLYGSNRPYSVVLSLFVYLLMVLTLDESAGLRINDITLSGNLYSLAIGPGIPWAMSRLERVSMLQLFRSPQQNAYIRRFLNYVLPTLAIVGVMVAVNQGMPVLLRFLRVDAWHANTTWADSFAGLLGYSMALSALWTAGIHGTVALAPWVGDLNNNFNENLAAQAAGHAAPHLFPTPAFSAFVHLGGSGTALALALAVLLVSRSRTKRLICSSALPILCFNVNELLIYGLPVIFNRYLVIPFVLAPLACTSVAYFAIANGLVPVPTVAPGWTAPPLLGAWLATRGSWAAVALAAFNLAMAIAVYIPFIRRWEAAQRALDVNMLEFKDRFRLDPERPVAYIESDVLDPAPNDDDELRDALALLRAGTLCMHYQPIVRISDGRIVAVESLLRLNHPQRGLLPPTFLGALKRAHLSTDIDGWVVENLAPEWNEWDASRVPLPVIQINIHPKSLLDVRLLERLIEVGRMLPLGVEIVEDELPDKLGTILSSIALLRSNGIRLAIDDFGTGYSSLSRLAQLGVAEMKIDKSMLDAAFEQPRGKQLLNGVIDFAKKLEMSVCVEGVERIEQLRFLQACGADRVQGYLLARPMPWSAMRELIESGRPLPGFDGRPDQNATPAR